MNECDSSGLIYATPLPPGLLRRNRPGKDGRLGSYKLRFCYRPRGNESAVSLEIGLHTRDINEAHARAVLILRAYAAAGQLLGLHAGGLDLSLRRLPDRH